MHADMKPANCVTDDHKNSTSISYRTEEDKEMIIDLDIETTLQSWLKHMGLFVMVAGI